MKGTFDPSQSFPNAVRLHVLNLAWSSDHLLFQLNFHKRDFSSINYHRVAYIDTEY